MADAFDRLPGRDSAQGDAFDRFPIEEESFGKSSLRTALQVPQGIAATTAPGLAAGFWQMLGAGELNDPEEIDRLKAISEREGVPFDEEAYLKAGENALNYIPTVSNIAREVEGKTGIPLEPKTRLQKGLRFATEATRLAPGRNSPFKSQQYPGTFRRMTTELPRPVLGAGVEATKELLQELGIPEQISELASFGILKQAPAGAPSIRFGEKLKPSGLTERRYENLKKQTEVSPSTIRKINETVENEFKDITNQIIESSPIKETHQSLANDVTFKKKAHEGFKEVADLSEQLPNTFDTKNLKSDLKNVISKKKNESLTPSEFDKAHNKFIEQYINETPDKPFTAKELVNQYRKNNRQLSEAFEPGQSFAYNRAKREALLDYNRVIGEMIEKEFPNSEFSKLFKETNKLWAEISNSEAITKFLDDLFKDGVNYKRARQLFDKQGMTVPFKKALGEEGFAKFETLLNDLLSTEKGMKMLKAAEQKGWLDYAKSFSPYILHPTAGNIALGIKALKGGYNKIFQMVLHKPQLAVTWDRGLNALKRGDFKAAEKEFVKVRAQDAIVTKEEAARQEAVRKFNEHRKNKALTEASEPPSPPSEVEIQQPSQQGSEDISSIGNMGKGMIDNFYEGIFKSLVERKDTFAGVKDPLIKAAKPYYEKGLIKNIEDLKTFANQLKTTIKAPRKKSF